MEGIPQLSATAITEVIETAIWKGTVCQSQSVSLVLAGLFQEVQEAFSRSYVHSIHCKIWSIVYRDVASPLFSQDCEWSVLGYLKLLMFCTNISLQVPIVQACKFETVTYCSYFSSWHSTVNICSPQLMNFQLLCLRLAQIAGSDLSTQKVKW